MDGADSGSEDKLHTGTTSALGNKCRNHLAARVAGRELSQQGKAAEVESGMGVLFGRAAARTVRAWRVPVRRGKLGQLGAWGVDPPKWRYTGWFGGFFARLGNTRNEDPVPANPREGRGSHHGAMGPDGVLNRGSMGPGAASSSSNMAPSEERAPTDCGRTAQKRENGEALAGKPSMAMLMLHPV